MCRYDESTHLYWDKNKVCDSRKEDKIYIYNGLCVCIQRIFTCYALALSAYTIWIEGPYPNRSDWLVDIHIPLAAQHAHNIHIRACKAPNKTNSQSQKPKQYEKWLLNLCGKRKLITQYNGKFVSFRFSFRFSFGLSLVCINICENEFMRNLRIHIRNGFIHDEAILYFCQHIDGHKEIFTFEWFRWRKQELKEMTRRKGEKKLTRQRRVVKNEMKNARKKSEKLAKLSTTNGTANGEHRAW